MCGRPGRGSRRQPLNEQDTTAVGSYVYFIQHGDWGPVKIGMAVDPEKRCCDLQTGNPEKLHVRVAVPGDRALEGELHRRFKEWHLHGEWFGGGEQSAAIIAFALGLEEDVAELTQTDGPVEWLEDARYPITAKERLDLRYDIERLWLRHFNAGEIAKELDTYWGLSEGAIRQEIAEMRKSTVWDVGKRASVVWWKPVRGAV